MSDSIHRAKPMMRFFLLLIVILCPSQAFAYDNYRLTIKINIDLNATQMAKLKTTDFRIYVLDGANIIGTSESVAAVVKELTPINGGITVTTEVISKVAESKKGILFGRIEFDQEYFYLPITTFDTSESEVIALVSATKRYERFFTGGFPLNESRGRGFFTEDNFAVVLHSLQIFIQEGTENEGIPENASAQILVLFKQNKTFFRSRSELAERAFTILVTSQDKPMSLVSENSFLEYYSELIGTSAKTTEVNGTLVIDRDLFNVSTESFFDIIRMSGNTTETARYINVALENLNTEKQYNWCIELFIEMHKKIGGLPRNTNRNDAIKVLQVASTCGHRAVTSDAGLVKDQVSIQLLELSQENKPIGIDFMKAYVDTAEKADKVGVIDPFTDMPRDLRDYFDSFQDAIRDKST
jgi:hypothetical protein